MGSWTIAFAYLYKKDGAFERRKEADLVGILNVWILEKKTQVSGHQLYYFFQIIGKHLEKEKLKGEKVCFFFFSQFREMQSIMARKGWGGKWGSCSHWICIRSQRVKNDGA